mgnify:FL=1
MNKVTINLQTNKEEFYKAYLNSINGILKMKGTELTVLYHFMNIKAERNTDKVVTSVTRKEVQKLMNTTPFNLNNYIKRLKDIKALVPNDDGSFNINPKLFFPISTSTITLLLNIND